MCALAGYYPATRKGLTPYDVTQDYGLAAEAWLEANRYLQADTLLAPVFAAIPGRAYEILDVKILSWPGHGGVEGVGLSVQREGVDARR